MNIKNFILATLVVSGFFNGLLHSSEAPLSSPSAFAQKLLESDNTTVIGMVSLSGSLVKYDNPEQGKQAAAKNIEDFIRSTQTKMPSATKTSAQLVTDGPVISGIKSNAIRYNYLQQYPQLHSNSFIITAEINNNGDVECSLKIACIIAPDKSDDFIYMDQKANHLCYNLRTIGQGILPPDHALAKSFTATEDKRQLDKLRGLSTATAATQQFRSPAAASTALLEKKIHGQSFTINAITSMTKKNISPSQALQALTRGQCMIAKTPGRLIFLDYKSGIGTVTEGDLEEGKETLKIFDVGYYAKEMDSLDQDPAVAASKVVTDTHEESLFCDALYMDYDRKCNILESKHNWHLIVPDNDWTEIARIINEVADTGARSVESNVLLGDKIIREKMINGRKIEVTYYIVPKFGQIKAYRTIYSARVIA